MGSSHPSCFSSTADFAVRISSRWRTFCQSTHAHCWCPSWPVREHFLLHWPHTRSYSWHSRHQKCIPVGSSNPPCNRSGSSTRQRERTNSSRNDGSKRQVNSWGRPFRNNSDSGMAFQLLNANHFPPRSLHWFDLIYHYDTIKASCIWAKNKHNNADKR